MGHPDPPESMQAAAVHGLQLGGDGGGGLGGGGEGEGGGGEGEGGGGEGGGEDDALLYWVMKALA